MPSEDKYKEKYVAFVDLLGFSALVAKSDADFDEQARIIDALDLVRKTIGSNARIDLVLTTFSDCVVISAERTPIGLVAMIRAVRTLATNLLSLRILIRGGFVTGRVYHDAENVFGPGMVAAYCYEHNLAKMPQIVIADDVRADCVALGCSLDGFLLDGPDGTMIDYLGMFSSFRDEKKPGEIELFRTAKLIVNHIRSDLRHQRADVVAKAKWFQTYWNETVANRGILPTIVDDDSPMFPDSETGPTILRIYPVAGKMAVPPTT